MLLCLSSVDFGVLEEAVDLAGDVAFEAALGFSGGFAFGGSFGDVGLGVWAVAAAGDGDGVQCSVELAVAAAVGAVAGVLPGGRFEWGDAGEATSRSFAIVDRSTRARSAASPTVVSPRTSCIQISYF